MKSSESLPVVAAFDFDGTVTYRDTLLPFLIEVKGLFSTFLNLAKELPALAGFVLGIVPRQRAKEAILSRFFKGKAIGEVFALGKIYAQGTLKTKIRPEALQRIHWHLKQGHRCVLISASLDIYLNQWAHDIGIHDTITSHLDVDSSGVVTGRLLGDNCWGPEKLRRMEELLGPRRGYLLYAYGDSRGDKEMLENADYPYFKQMPTGQPGEHP